MPYIHSLEVIIYNIFSVSVFYDQSYNILCGIFYCGIMALKELQVWGLERRLKG